MHPVPLYCALIVPCGSIWPSTRTDLSLRISRTPCGLTVPSQAADPDATMTPFLIVGGASAPLGGHFARGALGFFDTSLEIPA